MQSTHDTIGTLSGAVYLRSEKGAQFQVACRTAWDDAPERLAGECPVVQALSARTIVTDSRVLRELGAALGCVLEVEGAAIGLILLGPKEDGTPYSPEDQNFLLALARTAALALRGAQGHRTINSLKEELQDKVQKIAEQQRRIMILQSELLNRGLSAEPVKVRAGDGGELKHEIRGSSPAIRELLAHVAKIAQSSSSVMIRGESGTGKELLAQAIHFNSPRAAKPFVQVHCAALSPGLLESELFGHVKGAFTGADRDKIGRFELADGGTLFLDEIGDMPPEAQTRLLRVLQEGEFTSVGGRQPIRANVRIVAATHRDLRQAIRAGQFREDLFYRLNVVPIRLPPLRERAEDIAVLARHFLEKARDSGLPSKTLDQGAIDALRSYRWPGNVRELENLMRRLAALTPQEVITGEVIAAELAEPAGQACDPELYSNGEDLGQAVERHIRQVLAASNDGMPTRDIYDQVLAEVERPLIKMTLAATRGNQIKAAAMLGLNRNTLRKKIKDLEIPVVRGIG
jgi:two-component system nitrogen regulation response regulator GlnG